MKSCGWFERSLGTVVKRSKGDVNDILITNIIEHNCCPPERPQAGESKLEKGLLRKGRCSSSFSSAPAGFGFEWSFFSFCWSSVNFKRLCGQSTDRGRFSWSETSTANTSIQ
jgi:hypothetical protein